MKLGASHPMGPLALGDLIGLDVVLAIMEVLQAESGDNNGDWISLEEYFGITSEYPD